MSRRVSLVAGPAAVLAAGALLLGGCAVGEGAPEPAAPDAGVQLFERPWTSIADECETTIGPAGFGWVLTSPPQEHIAGDAWWTSYQPVSYLLDSKLGTEDEFADMVARCAASGVDVIADAVINHMAGIEGGVGFAGTEFTHYAYPGLYGESDFHHCGLTPDDDIADYSSREQVQTCELVNLADLDTASPGVRGALSGYLLRLLDLGVAGFRIDAAKHIAAEDVASVVEALPAESVIVSEVIRGSADEPIQPEEYLGSGDVFEFQYARDLSPALAAGFPPQPELGDQRPLHVPSESAVVFVDNHDTERGEAGLTYTDGGLYLIANAIMLADDYGTPVVYSGYAFTDRDAGPPQNADGRVTGWTCDGVDGPQESYVDGEGVCTEAWTAIGGMLEFRAYAGDAPRLPGVDDGRVSGFERDGRGMLLVNPTDADLPATVDTGLPAGDYCDVISGGRDAGADGGCRGATLSVADGRLSATVPALSAVAIHVGDRP